MFSTEKKRTNNSYRTIFHYLRRQSRSFTLHTSWGRYVVVCQPEINTKQQQQQQQQVSIVHFCGAGSSADLCYHTVPVVSDQMSPGDTAMKSSKNGDEGWWFNSPFTLHALLCYSVLLRCWMELPSS